ncbi:hypothetical protein [Streptomyces sp. Qhu_M48]|uniref:hypothetical protein n=1 Tax=Streptomyces sp. Qhu_M48 TaxID=3435889 RepID=UPI003F4F4977
MTPGRCSRGLRAAMFAVVCVLLAATGHVVMSGRGVPGWTLLLALAGTVAVAWALAGRERGPWAVTAATVAVQGLLHTVFSWARPPVAVPAPAARTVTDHAHTGHGMLSHAAMGHGAAVPAADANVGAGANVVRGIAEAPVAHDMTDIASSWGMLSAHLLAALLSGLWLAYGERAAFRLLRALPLGLFRPLRLLIAAVVPVPARRPALRPVRAGDERVPRRLLLTHSVISRGPPRVFAVL